MSSAFMVMECSAGARMMRWISWMGSATPTAAPVTNARLVGFNTLDRHSGTSLSCQGKMREMFKLRRG